MNRPSVAGELHPQLGPSLMATRNVARPSESRAAPGTSTRDGVLIGDSGTSVTTATSATSTTTAETAKSHRHERWSTITPESGRPIPPAAPYTAESATPITTKLPTDRPVAMAVDTNGDVQDVSVLRSPLS